MEDHFLLQKHHSEHLDEVVDIEADEEGPVHSTSVGGGEGRGGEGRRGEGRERKREGRGGREVITKLSLS